jgi:FtsH-binding integral membrane protein
MALLLPGTILVLASAILLLLAMPITARVAIGLAIALLGAVAFAGYTAAMYNRILAPIWGRLADVLEWLALMSVVPLVLGVCGTYAWIMNVANPH